MQKTSGAVFDNLSLAINQIHQELERKDLLPLYVHITNRQTEHPASKVALPINRMMLFQHGNFLREKLLEQIQAESNDHARVLTPDCEALYYTANIMKQDNLEKFLARDQTEEEFEKKSLKALFTANEITNALGLRLEVISFIEKVGYNHVAITIWSGLIPSDSILGIIHEAVMDNRSPAEKLYIDADLTLKIIERKVG